jgi:uncharacterized protein YybS (DUF2232 family)
MNELIDERVAEVLDGLGLLRSKAKLVEQAANLMSSNAFDAVVWILSMSSSAISQCMPFPITRRLSWAFAVVMPLISCIEISHCSPLMLGKKQY